MHAVKKYMGSSIGKKQMMGATGIFLYFYLFIHLIGQFSAFTGAEKYNKYGYLLLHELGELILPIEFALIAALFIHVALAIRLRIENKAARPIAYTVTPNHGSKTRYSTTMMLTGSSILLFVIIHIAHFRYGAVTGHTTVNYDGIEMRDLYGTMMEAFGHLWYSVAYIIVFGLIFNHLAHGVQSSLQSLGLNHPKYTPAVKFLGLAYAICISGGFSLFAVWAYFQNGGI